MTPWAGPTVAVLVPYRGDRGGPRDEAWQYMLRWWMREHRSWKVFLGDDQGGANPWCKAAAVNLALDKALKTRPVPDILVIADADVICHGIGDAAAAVAHGIATWAVPFTRVNRLTPAATHAVYAAGPDAQLPETPRFGRWSPQDRPHASSPQLLNSYVGMIGGGLVVLPRTLYEQVPLDPRFVGYGQEDASWGFALRVLAGEPWRSAEPLWHLWHPAQPQSSIAGVGSSEGLALYQRYLRANSPDDMRALIAEFRR